jgi:hypothetical protein
LRLPYPIVHMMDLAKLRPETSRFPYPGKKYPLGQ